MHPPTDTTQQFIMIYEYDANNVDALHPKEVDSGSYPRDGLADVKRHSYMRKNSVHGEYDAQRCLTQFAAQPENCLFGSICTRAKQKASRTTSMHRLCTSRSACRNNLFRLRQHKHQHCLVDKAHWCCTTRFYRALRGGVKQKKQ